MDVVDAERENGRTDEDDGYALDEVEGAPAMRNLAGSSEAAALFEAHGSPKVHGSAEASGPAEAPVPSEVHGSPGTSGSAEPIQSGSPDPSSIFEISRSVWRCVVSRGINITSPK